ncbi:MAG: hypothetical protein SGJ27_21410 [Candidatus Melainabacteria bacterium]|nr:hypothetical protein [Candidatus Melainabacteria bacterium]
MCLNEQMNKTLINTVIASLCFVNLTCCQIASGSELSSSGETIKSAPSGSTPTGATTTTTDTTTPERVERFVKRVVNLRNLPKFTKANITESTGLKIEWHGVAMSVSKDSGRDSDIIDHIEVANDRKGQITSVTLFPSKNLTVKSADVTNSFGAGQTSGVTDCWSHLQKKYGYKRELTKTYKKSGLVTQFDIIVEPHERLYSVSFFR